MKGYSKLLRRQNLKDLSLDSPSTHIYQPPGLAGVVSHVRLFHLVP